MLSPFRRKYSQVQATKSWLLCHEEHRGVLAVSGPQVKVKAVTTVKIVCVWPRAQQGPQPAALRCKITLTREE